MPVDPLPSVADAAPPRCERWPAWGLALAVVLAFSPVITAEFVRWDDPHNTFGNEYVRSPSAEGLLWFWTHAFGDLYIPVTYTLWVVIALGARTQTPDALGATLNPYLFHAANLLLHVGSALAVYHILRRLTRLPVAAALGAGVFALHPVQVESVAWVSGMKDVLAGCLALVALYLYLRQATYEGPCARRVWLYAGATACFVLAMLSKPSAVALPLVAGVIDWILLRRRPLRVLREAGSWLVLAVPVIVVGKLAQPAARLEFVPPVYARPVVALDALAFYLYKLVAPVHLAIDYGRSPKWLWGSSQIYWTWLVPVGVACGAALLRRRHPAAAAGGAVFALALLPTLGLVPFDFQAYSTVADHYLYLAMLGPALLAAALLARAAEAPGLRAPALAVMALLLAVLAVRTFRQCLHWKDSEALFTHTLDVNPASLAGNVQLGQLRYDAAISLLSAEHLSRLPPDQRLAAAKRGRALLEEAAGLYQKARLTAPDDPDIHFNLGNTLFYLNRRQEAAEHYRRVLRLIADPSDRRAAEARAKLERLGGSG